MDVNAIRTRRSSQHVSCVLCLVSSSPSLLSSSAFFLLCCCCCCRSVSRPRAAFPPTPRQLLFPGRRQPPISLAQTPKTHTRQDDDQDEYNRLRVQPSLDCLPTSGEETPTIHTLFTSINHLSSLRDTSSSKLASGSQLSVTPSTIAILTPSA